MCSEEDRKPAKKMCLKCEISMCVQHLQAHLTTPVLLQTHPLTEPTALGAATKCPQHGKLLEYFCLDDMACVCVSCAIEDQHRLHNMKTFSTAQKELMEKLIIEHKALQSKTEEDNMSLEKWEKGKREELSMGAVRLVEAVNNLRDLSLTSVQSSVSARMVSIRTSKSSIQSIQGEKDTFRFLQMYSQVHQDLEKAKAVDLRKGLEPGEHRNKLVQEIMQSGEKILMDTTHFLRSLLSLVDPENHQTCGIASPDLFFEPLTQKSSISVSKDKRTVFYNSGMGDSSTTLLIKSSKSTPNLQRWIVVLTEDADWMVGFCDKRSPQNFKDGPVYGLSYRSHFQTKMRQLAVGRIFRTPQKTPVHIAGTPTLSGSGENPPQTHRADISRPLCLPLVSESRKVIWVDSEQVELQLKEQPELENAFDQFPYLTVKQTAALAQSCSLHPDQVKVWFMAKRLEYGISWDCEDIHEVYGKIRAGQGDEGEEKGPDSSAMRSGEEQSVEDRGLLGACEAMKQKPEQGQPQRNGKKGKLEEKKSKKRKKKSVVNRRKKKQTIEGTAKKATNPMLKSNTLLDGAINTRKRTRKRPVSNRVNPPNKSRPLPDDPLSPDITVPTNPANRCFGESKEVKIEQREESKNATDVKLKELIKGSDSPITDDQTTFPKQQHGDVPHPYKNPSQTFVRRKTDFQLLTLKMAFLDSQYPTSELYCHLNEVTGINRTNLVKWFRDMRYYTKKQKPGWMTVEKHKQVLGNILYRQCINKIRKMEKQENV
ncbi:hypothetical protein OJAV_G00180910 [Oryzias javanicus]|uniref:B box-type domain-containing protein n=1 Tax=Oryzias javanicus TaxID=123683 RepID=A0A3S2U179_ORYJA|nr:hypothetical protein OJAV_G00180910 [Oryzias javanicus]